MFEHMRAWLTFLISRSHGTYSCYYLYLFPDPEWNLQPPPRAIELQIILGFAPRLAARLIANFIHSHFSDKTTLYLNWQNCNLI